MPLRTGAWTPTPVLFQPSHSVEELRGPHRYTPGDSDQLHDPDCQGLRSRSQGKGHPCTSKCGTLALQGSAPGFSSTSLPDPVAKPVVATPSDE